MKYLSFQFSASRLSLERDLCLVCKACCVLGRYDSQSDSQYQTKRQLRYCYNRYVQSRSGGFLFERGDFVRTIEFLVILPVLPFRLEMLYHRSQVKIPHFRI